MKTLACTVLMLLATTGLWGQGTKSAQDPALVAEVKQSIMARRAAALKHDRTAYASYLADEVIFIDGDNGEVVNRAQILDGVARTDGPPETYSEPLELTAWREGDLVFAHYRSVETQMFGSQAYREEFRAIHIFRKTKSGLKVVFFQGTIIPNTQRAGAKVDPAVYDKYVGQYSAGPGDAETVTREGEKLFLTIGGDRLELKPIDAETFFIPKLGDDWVFVKNGQGEVVGLESRLWGQNILAKKIN
jgi:ketosteroid isomerase-like protein